MRLEDLNAAQRTAASTLQGRVLVQAGAGSGKTRMLVARITHALLSEFTQLDRIMAITFTDKAAGELAERVRADLREEHRADDARDVDGAWISTIHGACSRILRDNALEIGLDPAFSVLSGVDGFAMLEEAFETAAQEAAADPLIAEAFGLFGYSGVRAFVLRQGTACRLKGLDPTALRTSDAREPNRIVDDVRGAVRDALAALEDLDAPDSTKQPFVVALGEYQRRLAGLTAAQGESPLELLASLSISYDTTPKKPIKDVTAELGGMIDQASRELIGAWSGPMAAALGALTGRAMRLLEDAKRLRAALDFDDLQVMTAQLLAKRPELAERYRDAFDMVMVDEFQDTDSLQLQIVEAIAGENLCTVGDARQSIYRFRGAELGVYEQHIEDMRAAGAEPIELVDNYRSAADILTFVNTLFDSPELFDGGLLALNAARSAGDAWIEGTRLSSQTPRIEAIFAPASSSKALARPAAASEVARRIRDLVDAGVPQSDIVVLVRAYTLAEPYAAALRAVGLRPIVLGGSRFLTMPEVVLVEQLARAIANPEDEQALGVVLASDLARLSDDALAALRSEKGRGLWDALCSDDLAFSAADARRAVAVVDAIETARGRLGVLPVSETLLEAIEKLDFDLVLLARGDAGREGFANVLKLLRLADEAEAAGSYGPAAFAEYVALKREFRDTEAPATIADTDTPAIRIMSVHASKGLEFPVVVVPELGNASGGGSGDGDHTYRFEIEGDRTAVGFCLPSSLVPGKVRSDQVFDELKQAQSQGDVDEYKRLLYVAFTRAREMLILTAIGPAKPTETPGGFMWIRNLFGLTDELAPLDEIREIGDGPSVACRVTVIDPAETELLEDPGAAEPTAMNEADECSAVRAPSRQAFEPPRHLAYSHLALYERCPQRFFAERVAGVRPMKVPGAGSATNFGDALHRAMELRVSEGHLTDDWLLALLESNGFEPHDLQRLRDALDEIHSVDEVRAALAANGRAEMPFAFRVGSDADGFVLEGSMDLYARSGGATTIVDYKSGTSGDLDELESRYELQARCYALAALADGADTVRVTFVRPEVRVDDVVQTVGFEFTVSDREGIENDLISRYTAMGEGAYERRADWDENVCDTCALYETVCDVSRGASRGSVGPGA